MKTSVKQSINQSSLLSYVRHGCPVARARGSCLKRKTKLSMSKHDYMKYIKNMSKNRTVVAEELFSINMNIVIVMFHFRSADLFFTCGQRIRT